MYGWRGKLGVMLTSSDPTTEAEFSKHLPRGVSLHASRMHLEDGDVSPETLERMASDVERCARLLETVDVDVVAYNCTTGSLLKGPGYEEDIEERIQSEVGVPAVATAASIKRAFDELGAESLAIATPYVESLNELEREFLERSGYDVLDIEGLGLTTDAEIGQRPSQVAYQQAVAIDRAEADAVFVSCTGTRTFEIIEDLERDIGKPVVTSNQATLWDALRRIDVDYSELNLGRLFSQ